MPSYVLCNLLLLSVYNNSLRKYLTKIYIFNPQPSIFIISPVTMANLDIGSYSGSQSSNFYYSDTNICYEREINKGTVHICQVYLSYNGFDNNLSNYHKLTFFSHLFVDNFQNILITLN